MSWRGYRGSPPFWIVRATQSRRHDQSMTIVWRGVRGGEIDFCALAALRRLCGKQTHQVSLFLLLHLVVTVGRGALKSRVIVLAVLIGLIGLGVLVTLVVVVTLVVLVILVVLVGRGQWCIEVVERREPVHQSVETGT